MDGEKNYLRRNVLKTGLATTVAGHIGAGTVAASSSTNPVSVEEAGIRQEVEKLLDDYRTFEALELMDEHDVDCTATYNSLSGEEQDALESLSSNETRSNSSGSVSTQDFFAKDESSITVFAFRLHQDFYRARIDFSVEAYDDAADPDLPGTNDLIALGYSQPNEAVSGELDYGLANYKDDVLSVEEKPVVNGPGAVISLNDIRTEPNQSKYRGHLYYRIDKDGSDKETVVGEYNHTWSIGNLGGLGQVTFSWSGLGIAVDPGKLNDKWTIASSGRF